MAQKIPIKLTAVNYPYGFSAGDINALLTVIAGYLSASIDLNTVSFFTQGTVDPTSDQGIFYNQTQQLFKAWDIPTGKYQPIGLQYAIGDTKQSFIVSDQPSQGWVMLDGRLLTAVPGISANQLNSLQVLFGNSPTQALPNWTSTSGIQNLPAANAFSSISVTSYLPPTGQVSGLTFSSPPLNTEVQALAQNVEQSVDSGSALQTAFTQLQTVAEALLDALNTMNSGGTPKSVWLVQVGLP